VTDQLVEGLSRDFGVHPYGKWRGAFWRLISLAELDAGPTPGARAAADAALTWLASPARLNRIHKRVIEGRTRRCASQDGRALWACRRLGIEDPRLDTLAESLVATQWPDGGWNCDVRPEASHSSFHETWGPITGLAAYGASEATQRGAEYLLRHRAVFSERTGQVAHPVFLQLRFPPYWHYDLLAGLRTIGEAGALGDSRVTDALDLLESKRQKDGTWRCEGKWWKRPGSKGSNVEAVDWGPAADELLTERAVEVLRTAGRA
jgi:hypothetical protein